MLETFEKASMKRDIEVRDLIWISGTILDSRGLYVEFRFWEPALLVRLPLLLATHSFLGFSSAKWHQPHFCCCHCTRREKSLTRRFFLATFLFWRELLDKSPKWIRNWCSWCPPILILNFSESSFNATSPYALSLANQNDWNQNIASILYQ